ncbi:MAG: hypothetical protein ACOC43_14215 [Desulfohalobiaceae bacterium]
MIISTAALALSRPLEPTRFPGGLLQLPGRCDSRNDPSPDLGPRW